MATKNELFQRYLEEYLRTSRKRKGEILETVSDAAQMHRKSVVRRFRVLQMRYTTHQDCRGRPVEYGNDVTTALKFVWEIANEACAELLHPVVSDYVTVLLRDKMWPHSTQATDKLFHMSLGTMKNRIARFQKIRSNRKGISGTKPSTLKEIIPIFTGPWSEKDPGYGQTDTVAHCGSALVGDFIWTVNYADIATCWGSRRAQMNKGQRATCESLQYIQGALPFPLLGLHPDTGSEFINWHVKGWCDATRPKIELTRSRPYRKNDNAYVEQKNGHVVRRWIGYSRLDNPELLPVMNNLYLHLDLYLNHFMPTRKCIEKERVGSRYRRKYDKAKTPYERVLAHPAVSKDVKIRLQKEHAKLNPLVLKEKIAKLRKELFNLQKRLSNPSI